jgi:murein L,D-transpeptidase YcbB/YkuD
MPRTDADMAMRIDTSLELLMSQAVLHYAADIAQGAISHQWNTGKVAFSDEDRLALLAKAAQEVDPAAFLAALAPFNSAYTALKTTMQHYQAIAAQGGWPAFMPGKDIKSGSSDPRLATVKQILGITGDLSPDLSSQIYDTGLIDGVKKFQKRHGINPDGVINNATQAALAVPVDQRIAEIAMSMERMRWMPRDLGSRYVMVNIPDNSLTAVSPGRTLQMAVITGKPSTPTPMFSKTINDVVFNPSWSVPAKIAVNELLPKLRKNPDFLIKAGYTVLNHAQIVDPSSIDWNSIGHGNTAYSFRQNPGDGNALGKVKFNIPDSDNIYLHDTSQHKLFAHTERNLSHGCVRVENPKMLTEFALEGEGWTADKINTVYDSKTSRTVHISALPVYLVYWTTWVDNLGAVHFDPDIYSLNKPLLAKMNSLRRQNRGSEMAMNG